MEDNNEYLSEEQYQKINKKVVISGKILLSIGIIGFIVSSVMMFGGFISFETRAKIGPLWVGCFACIGIGLGLSMTGNRRKIQAYMMQQQIPIAKEGIEKMGPTVTKVAKEIKEGLKDEDLIYCKHCGEQIDADSTFCKKCGKEQ